MAFSFSQLLGSRIRQGILKVDRAVYGKQVLESLGHQLTLEYGQGFSRSSLTRMVQFTELFPNSEIVATLSHKLSWSHFREILPIDDDLKRNFYAEMGAVEGGAFAYSKTRCADRTVAGSTLEIFASDSKVKIARAIFSNAVFHHCLSNPLRSSCHSD
ncbi:MAG: hypothetical protein K2Y39_18015 [Candidatus Obscuribacterales bacterium]|nr:hypothetical protein [Candidatus Obscuribacterales bacterium]